VTKVGVVVDGSSDLTNTSIARDLSVGFFFTGFCCILVSSENFKNQTKNLNVQLSKRFSP
jgi:hypothetical protein